MSRTEKDRPYWVRRNDKSMPRVAYHDHHQAGAPVLGRVPVTDENGNPVKETYSYGRFFLGYRIYNYYEHDYDEFATLAEFKAYCAQQQAAREAEGVLLFFPEEHYRHYGPREAERVKHETKVIGHRPTECTIDLPTPRGQRYRDELLTHLCHYDVSYYGGHKWYRDRPMAEEKKAYHRAARSNENMSLRALTNAVNSGWDGDEDGHEDVFELRSQRHRGWWD